VSFEDHYKRLWHEEQDAGKALRADLAKAHDRIAFLEQRERDVCAAVGGVSDGGRYRNDVIEHLKGQTSDLAKAQARCVEMEAALRKAFAIIAPRAEEQGYGGFPGGDPRKFSPDPECSTPEEREAHRLACAAAEQGQTDLRGEARYGAEAAAEAAKGNATHGLAVGGQVLHVHVPMFGLGVYAMVDEDLDQACGLMEAAFHGSDGTSALASVRLAQRALTGESGPLERSVALKHLDEAFGSRE